MVLLSQLESKRLILRPFTQGTFEVFSNIINDAQVSKNLKFVLKTEIGKNIEDLFHSIIKSYSTSEQMVALEIIIKGNGEPIGLCGLIPLKDKKIVECFYALLPRFRGQGFAIEAMKKLIDYAFLNLNISKVIAILNPRNSKLWKVAERIGMKYLGHIQLKEILSKAMYFSIEKTEFEAQKF
ncbi:MAG: GNAT family N-acetyltransferase [Candidatus Hodarchaeota archaeon]